MSFGVPRHIRPRCRVSAPLAVSAILALGALCARPAAAQIVYDSTANPILPAAILPNAAPAPVNGAADDYFSTLFPAADNMILTQLQFFGGVHFAGAPDGTNNVLNFRFLDQFGVPTAVNFQVAFPTSGDSLYTILVGANGIPANSVVKTAGVLEITTLNTTAVGAWAFTNTPPSVGINNPANAGIRSFSLGAVAAAPEPASVALLLLGAGVLPLVRRRTRRV